MAGNKFDEISLVMQEQMETSDFFRSLSQTEEEETPKNQEKQRKKERQEKITEL